MRPQTPWVKRNRTSGAIPLAITNLPEEVVVTLSHMFSVAGWVRRGV
jgi:hypothetical protein